MPSKRLNQQVARAGIASRRGSEALIERGEISVNDQVVKTPYFRVDPDKDIITWRGKALPQRVSPLLIVLNKPKGWICSTSPREGKRLVTDIFKPLGVRLFTVGRLDRDTTGLLLLTNDGDLCQKIIHPSSSLTKEYLIKCREEITAQHLHILRQGLKVEGVFVRPVKVRKVRRGTLKIGVKEGKKHEVRLMIRAAGLSLLMLHRIRVGGLHLGGIPEGQWRQLQAGEERVIFE
ncbi:MAG: pseudouridine synthase [Chlamydiota bacterium]|nr:pseudouridine synthase [Chlamydiota bacterium]